MACLTPHGPDTALEKPVYGFKEHPLMPQYRDQAGFLFSWSRWLLLREEGLSDA